MKIKTKGLEPAVRRATNISKLCFMPGNYLKIETGKNKLILTSTNANEWLKEEIDAEGTLDFSGCVDPKRLQATLVLSGEDTNLESKGTRTLLVKNGALATLKATPSEEFPNVPPMVGAVSVLENGEPLGATIDRVAFCSYKDDGRQTLKSVSIIGDGKRVVVQASNGGSAAFATVDYDCKCELLIVSEHAPNFAAALSNEGSKLFVKDGLVSVKHKQGAYCCSQLEGKYPDTSNIRLGLEKDFSPSNKLGKLNRDWFAETLSVAISLHTDTRNLPVVDFSCSKNGCEIKTENFERTFAGSFGEFEARFDASKLLACVRSFELVEIEMSATPLGCLHLDVANYKTVNMPMRMA